MSKIVGFLESIGQDANLRDAPPEEFKLALNDDELSLEAQTAILEKDELGLAELIGARVITCCMVLPGKEEDDESEEEPSKDDDEVRSLLVLHRHVA
jgi:hypothetical protein